MSRTDHQSMTPGRAVPAVPGQASTTVTLRQGGVFGPWAVTGSFWALALFIALGSVATVRTVGDGVAALAAVLLLALVGWLVGAFCRLVITPTEVRVVNLLRTTRIPRFRIDHVSDHGVVAIHAQRGGHPYVVRSWGAPSAPRQGHVNARNIRLAERKGAQLSGTGVVGTGVVSRLATPTSPSSPNEPASVRVSWNVRPLLLLCFLVALNVSIWLR